MTRSLWKGPFVDGYMLKKADASRIAGRALKNAKQLLIRLTDRDVARDNCYSPVGRFNAAAT